MNRRTARVILIVVVLLCTSLACISGGGGGGGGNAQATKSEAAVQTQAARLWQVQLTAQAGAMEP